MVANILLAVVVLSTLCILGVLIPSWTHIQSEEPQKNPHFTRRVFGMHKR